MQGMVTAGDGFDHYPGWQDQTRPRRHSQVVEGIGQVRVGQECVGAGDSTAHSDTVGSIPYPTVPSQQGIARIRTAECGVYRVGRVAEELRVCDRRRVPDRYLHPVA